MKKIILITLAIVFLWTARFERVEATELIGAGGLARWQIGALEAGLLIADWGEQEFVFAVAGYRDGRYWRGWIVQVAGQPLENYGPYACGTEKIICYLREDTHKWQGYIWFRGHERRFCGGQKELPASCMLKVGE